MAVASFDLATIEAISNILGHTEQGISGAQITQYLGECRIVDPGLNSTKRKRLYDSLILKQSQDNCANNLVDFIQHVMKPSRYLSNPEWFEAMRSEINRVLGFEGLELKSNGLIQKASKVNTLSEAEERATNLRQNLLTRRVHPDVLYFCRQELLVDNYFHAVFEATKSVAEKIRTKTGLTSDGSALVDEAFSFKNKVPYLALNKLETESEQSEQRGFTHLLKGIFGTFRNTAAHAPKVVWRIEEQDALDMLSTVSLIHRRLDNAVEAKKQYLGVP